MNTHQDLDELLRAFNAIAIAPAPFRSSRQQTFEVLLAPIVAERSDLIFGLDGAWDAISDERAARGVGRLDWEPQDPDYQKALDLWEDWLARYVAIEEALRTCQRSVTEPVRIVRVDPPMLSASMQPLPGLPISRVSW